MQEVILHVIDNDDGWIVWEAETYVGRARIKEANQDFHHEKYIVRKGFRIGLRSPVTYR